jgi:hypothetical protein
MRSFIGVLGFALACGSGALVWAQPGAAPQGSRGGQTQLVPQPPGSLGVVPWFQNPNVIRELRITDPQMRRLADVYGQLFGPYQTELGNLQGLDPAQRVARINELNMAFDNSMNKSAADILNERQIQRFNQLYTQQQGFEAFTNPELRRRLSLADTQLEQLRKANQDFDQQLRDLSKASQGDPRTWQTLYRMRSDRINDLLTDQQRQMWRQMTGDTFTFPPIPLTPPFKAPPR